mgnify:CR=1 FL=1
MCVTPLGARKPTSKSRFPLPVPLQILLGGPVLLLIFGWTLLYDKLRQGR